MAQEVLLFISLIIGIAAFLTVIARIVRQPPILAYLVAGIIVGPLALNFIGSGGASPEVIQMFARIGVAFLLFIVGLSLDIKLLKEVGKVSIIGGLGEIILVGIAGFLIAEALGFSAIVGVYLGIAIAFSSTVVVVKILSDKKEIGTLHGRIAIGILIVQDFAAAIVLMAVPLINSQEVYITILKEMSFIIGLIVIIFTVSHLFLGRLMNYLAKNQESLFLFGIAWALILAVAFDKLGFSLEVGALIAGMSLASSRYNLELGGKTKPLRDFFVVLFFVFFGSQLTGPIGWELLEKAIILSIFIVIAKTLIVMTILRIFGYKKRTNFLVGLSLAQISEFSLIFILLGYSMGALNQEIMNLSILVAIFTIGISSYILYHAHSIFNRISRYLSLFEGNRRDRDSEITDSYEVVLFGYHRIGYKLLGTLKKMKVHFAVVDYNPDVIESLIKMKVNCIYGDGGDRDFLNEMKLHKTKLVISTLPDASANLTIKEKLEEEKSEALFVATAEQPREALELYSKGADYVIVPHHLGGEYAANMLESMHLNKEKYREAGKKHLKELKQAKDSSTF